MAASRLLTGFLAGTALASAMPAFAQDAATAPADAATADQGVSGNDIVVTATRRAQSLQDVPLAVDVVGGETIEKFNLFDFKDVQAMTPGLQLSNNDGRSNVATLRGITFDPDSGSSPAVDTFFNEIALDPQTAFTSIYDIGQIEVLRGPQGLFRGRTSPAGSITLATRRPNMAEPEGYAQLTGTDLGGVNVQGAASLPLKQDVLAIRAAMLIDDNRANQVRNVSGERSHNSTQSVRLSLAYKPSSAFSANIMYQYLSSDVRPFIAVFGSGAQPSLLSPARSGPAIALEDRRSVTEIAPRFQNETHLVTAQLSYDFGAMALSYNGGYQDTTLTQYRDQDVANAVPNYSLPQLVRTPYRVWSNELRLESRGDSRLTWFLAANYNEQKNPVRVTQSNDLLLGLPFTPLPPAFGVVPVGVGVAIDVNVRNYSLAGSLGYEVIDGLTLTAGLRQTWYETGRVQTTSLAIGGGPASITRQTSQINTSYLTGGASLSYEVTRDFTAYASYGRSVRPGVFAVGVSVPLDPAYLLTPQETSDGGELGIKANLFGGRGSLNVAGFYQKFKNYIGFEACLTTNSSRIPGVVDTTCGPLPTFGNAQSKGVEVQFSLRPSRWIDLGLNASYADARYTNATVYCNDYNGDGIPDSRGTPSVPGTAQVARCTRNDRLAQVPKFSLSANAEVRAPIGELEAFGRTLVSYRPAFHSAVDDYDYRDITNVNLFLGLRGPERRWEVSLFAKNLLDQTRATRVSSGVAQFGTTDFGNGMTPPVAGAPFVSGYRTAVINAPRELGATLSFKW